jgi:hypothetical protein
VTIPISRTPSPVLPPSPYGQAQIFEQHSLWRPGCILYIRPLSYDVRDIPFDDRAMFSCIRLPVASPVVVSGLEGDPPARYLVSWVREDLLHWHVARRHRRA